MSHESNHSIEEKKSVNFLGPVIGGIIIWLIVLIIETNLDEPKTTQHSSHNTDAPQTEQVDGQHHE